MSAFDTSYKAGAAPILLALHGETVAYYPRDGEPREITAIVTRMPPEPVTGSQRARSPTWRIEVLNDAETGIAADALDTGGDEIRLTERFGDTSDSRRAIIKLVSHDGATLVLEAR